MSERWRCVEGWPYEVSSVGRVRRSDAPHGRTRVGKILSQSTTQKGYHRVALRDGDRRMSFFVHRLVARAFVDGHLPGLEVNHKNGDPGDNRASNLEWVTRKENNRHAREETGAWYPAMGEDAGGAKLTEDDVRAIRQSSKTQVALAQEYGVDQSAVSLIRNRKTWRHIP